MKTRRTSTHIPILLLTLIVPTSTWAFNLFSEPVQETVEWIQREAAPNGFLRFATGASPEPGCIPPEGAADPNLAFLSPRAFAEYQARKKLRPIIDEAEAKAIFEFLKKNPSIPFHYPDEGCFARAHEMARILELNGIDSKKRYLISGPDGLWALSEYVDGVDLPVAGYARWHYHVAPQIQVRLPDGRTEERVIDPSLSDQLLTPSQWQEIQGVESCKQVANLDSLDVRASLRSECEVFVAPRQSYQAAEEESWDPDQIRDSREVMKKFLPLSHLREIQHDFIYGKKDLEDASQALERASWSLNHAAGQLKEAGSKIQSGYPSKH